MTAFIEDLVAKIDIELAPIQAEIQQLKLARDALISESEPVSASSPKARLSAPRPKARARSEARTPPAEPAAVVPAGKLVTTLAAAGGQSSLNLAKATGGAVAQVRELLKVLEQDGQVRREGHARGLRWFAVTDGAATRSADGTPRARRAQRQKPHIARARARRS